MARRIPAFYHLLWAFPLATAALMTGVVSVCGAPGRSIAPLGWWPVVAVGASLSLAQVAALLLVYQRVRRRYVAHRRVASAHRRAVRERLAQTRARAEQLAVEDPMTGLYNKRYMERQLAAEFERSRRYGQPLSCAVLDGDFFKRVNDLFGHPAGDEVIRDMAAVLRAQARQSDLLGHYGGDEFLLLMPNTPLEAAGNLAERIRSVFEHHARLVDGQEVVTTCSIGIACFDGPEETDAAQLLARADHAMYEAKRRGRNRVCLWHPEGARELGPAAGE